MCHKSEIESCSENIAETINKEVDLAIQNIIGNEKYVPEYIKQFDMKKNEWSSLKLTNNSYCFGEAELKEDDDKNDDIFYYFAVHKTINHLIFARDIKSKFNTTAMHQLYISQDNGLGMYKVQIKDGKISNQFFVADDYIKDRCSRFREYMNDFEKLQNTTEVYTKQTMWHILQDNVIHVMNYIQRELEGDLRQEIDKSLEYCNMVLTYTAKSYLSLD